MTTQERRRWFMVASLFLVLLLVFGGGYNTVPVFLPALLRAFPGWSHQRVSILPSVLAASAGLSVFPVGWLIDRVEARVLMVAGGLAAGLSFMIASQADSLTTLTAAYLLLGVGISAGTVLPAAYVIANWFNARRGMAMGIAYSGSTVGGMVMTLIAGWFIRNQGWRIAYRAIGLPMIVVAVPLIAVAVRSRPGGARSIVTAAPAELPGFDASTALHTRSFWMIVLANFFFAFSAAGSLIHMVTHLERIGYRNEQAALATSLIFGCAALGKVLLGLLADRITARRALLLTFCVQAAGISLVFAAATTLMAGVFVVVYGLSVAAPLMLLPLLTAESLGLKRFGLLVGYAGVAQTVGAALGPLVAGRIFDQSGSYTSAFELFIVINLLGAVAAWTCRSYEQAREGFASAPLPASA
jgi:MFS family permease